MRPDDAPFSTPAASVRLFASARTQAASWALHGLVLTALLLIRGQPPATRGGVSLLIPVPVTAGFAIPAPSRGGGSGGRRDPLPASAGRPPRFTLAPLASPSSQPRTARLEVEPTLAGQAPELPSLDFERLGDPFAAFGPPSDGPGSRGGIGAGDDGGVGDGDGPGLGPNRGGAFTGAYRVGGGVSAPRLIRSVEPQYSEEARKAKYQGVVELEVAVGPDGLPRAIQVVRSLGMGLDEQAVEAVRQWVFEPGRKGGEPVTVLARVQVRFRLL